MKKQTILFQGDSITDCGRGREGDAPNVALGGGYPMLCAARLLADHPADDIAVFNRGISGNRVVDLYARWKIDALNLRPDVISILIGVNDTWHEFANRNGVELDRYVMIYRMLLDWTKQVLPEVKLVLCEPFVLECGAVNAEFAADVAPRRDAVRKLAADYGALFVPFQQIVTAGAKQAGAPEKILADGVHPTLLGHQLLTDAWLKAIESQNQ